MSHAIIIDTDPGQDDAIALLLAAASPELELLGVTTVAGNVPLALTTLNARKVMELAGRRDVPICAGANASGERRMCADTVRMTSMTTCSSSPAAVPVSTACLPAGAAPAAVLRVVPIVRWRV